MTCMKIPGHFDWNCLAPWFSYPIHITIWQKFNLEGSYEALNRSYGCYGSFLENDMQRKQYELACDIATHVFYHACTLYQEGCKLHRRLPYTKCDAWPSAGLHKHRQRDPNDGLHEYRQGWIKFRQDREACSEY